ncbi:MBL fold metallo-hydrolase [Paenibacillus sp. OV219]|uniref:MBL fold metallo-hydrolase n=1 Tax=Paenibacillus sp. OV219 TaxID=1884377 RepID=UPI0008B5D3C8|nr:MBL fold metallo-hydrolase [Paenibacillus sp. OV219]SEN20242.1 Beta-lactamase superfamily domain-containing protein [Paenibacillus sp. OV219]
MEYKIISTGSKGNCVIIENVMIDCGVPFKTIKEHLYGVSTLLLTHIHSDHIKEATLKNIVIMFPHIKIYGNYEVCQVYSEYPITCINEGIPFEDDGITFTPFKAIHDVVTYGYVWVWDGERIIYVTDTADLRNAPVQTYDHFFIESNHSEKKIETMKFDTRYGYNVYAGAKRHLSTEKAKLFYFMNRASAASTFVELHQSSRFY